MEPEGPGLALWRRKGGRVVIAPSLPKGILTALVTPVGSDGAVDHTALERLVARSVAGGVAGLSPCGSTGEGARLTFAQRMQLVESVLAVASSLPVIAAVPLSSMAAGREELAELGRLGVRAALVAPPSYYPAGERELVRLYGTLAEDSPVPIVLYHIPAFTSGIPIGAIEQLLDHPRVVGIKDSSRDLEYLQSLLMVVRASGKEDFTVYTGTDTLLVPSLLMGAGGAIAASPNLVPELGVAVLRATVEGRLQDAWEAQQQLAQVVGACRRGNFPAGWKAALELADLCSKDLVPPASSLPQNHIGDLQDSLEHLGVLTEAAFTRSRTSREAGRG